jgi:Tfp pilus assembly protein PilF
VLSPAEVHYNLGSIYEQQGRADDAKAEYHKALEADPSLKDARVRLSQMK